MAQKKQPFPHPAVWFFSETTMRPGETLCRIPVETCRTYQDFTAQLPGGLGEREALYFSIEGKGTFDFISFTLE